MIILKNSENKMALSEDKIKCIAGVKNQLSFKLSNQAALLPIDDLDHSYPIALKITEAFEFINQHLMENYDTLTATRLKDAFAYYHAFVTEESEIRLPLRELLFDFELYFTPVAKRADFLLQLEIIINELSNQILVKDTSIQQFLDQRDRTIS